MNKPRYLDLLHNGELEKRVDKLYSMLENCVLCPHQCKVNRLKGEPGFCRTLEKVIVSGAEPHYGEERELVGFHGSGTIFFSNCNLKCAFCQNYEISHCGDGSELDIEELADIMLRLQRIRCHNINLVSPSHIVPQVAGALLLAARKGLNIPVVYNTGGYDLVDTLVMLDGIVDIYMPDIKFADDGLARKYIGVRSYYTIAGNAIKEMHRQVGDLKTDDAGVAYRGLIVRHLVLPENLAGTDRIVRFLTDEISKDTYVNIMAQYYPAYKASTYSELGRKITRQEYRDALDMARSAGLTRVE